MLRLKVFINKNQIDDVVIQNISNLGEESYQYLVYKIDSNYKMKGKRVFVNHKREEGWEILVIKALKKLLEEEK